MNITKAFCLSIALFGASNMQAITNSDFVIQQDNTKINNYQTNRPLGMDVRKLFPEHTGYYCSF